MTDPIVAHIWFTDGVKRTVHQEASGRQYVLDEDGEQVHGVWFIPPEELIAPDASLTRDDAATSPMRRYLPLLVAVTIIVAAGTAIRHLAEADGGTTTGNNAVVEKVQDEELAITRYLIKHHGVRFIYSEGLSAKGMPDYRLRLDLTGSSTSDLSRWRLGTPGVSCWPRRFSTYCRSKMPLPRGRRTRRRR